MAVHLYLNVSLLAILLLYPDYMLQAIVIESIAHLDLSSYFI